MSCSCNYNSYWQYSLQLNRPNIWLTLKSLPAKITFKTSSISASLEFGEQLIISWDVIGVSSLSLYSANLAIVCLKSPGCKSDANVASWAKPSCVMFLVARFCNYFLNIEFIYWIIIDWRSKCIFFVQKIFEGLMMVLMIQR